MVWPPDYTVLFRQRQERMIQMVDDGKLRAAALVHYSNDPIAFINDWGITYDPRNISKKLPTTMPFQLFARQEVLVKFLLSCIDEDECGLIEKCRDMGATWVCVAFSVWLWLFREGSAVGWGSRKQDLVDKLGDPDSIFEKIRMFIRYLPVWIKPRGFNQNKHCSMMKVINPINGSIIAGECGDAIGRGGRKSIYFKDESAHYLRPEGIEASLGDNTNCQIDISSVRGTGNVFHRRRLSGEVWEPDTVVEPGTTRVLVMDWSDHPAKDQEWYDKRRDKAVREGLLHVFNQEVERDYAASVEGILIPSIWVKAAIDADKKLGFEDLGQQVAGFDPYDEGSDAHALIIRKGVVLKFADTWHDGDTGQATRKVVRICKERGIKNVQYDAIGIGSGVKAESNRLTTDKKMPKGLKFTAWRSTFAVLEPNKPIYESFDPDEMPPKNKDFYKNLKSQAYWQLRLRFERTYKAVTQDEKYDFDELISIPSDLKHLRKLENELSQPTYSEDGAARIMVDKAPPGTKSPNMADGTAMSYWPIKRFDPSSMVAIGAPAGEKTEGDFYELVESTKENAKIIEVDFFADGKQISNWKTMIVGGPG